MSEIEQLTKEIIALRQSNEQLLSKITSKEKDSVFITTLELQDRWCCKYALINTQMKKGLRSSKISKNRMMFRLSVVEAWENENF
jgi:hypothetical protein